MVGRVFGVRPGSLTLGRFMGLVRRLPLALAATTGTVTEEMDAHERTMERARANLIETRVAECFPD